MLEVWHLFLLLAYAILLILVGDKLYNIIRNIVQYFIDKGDEIHEIDVDNTLD